MACQQDRSGTHFYRPCLNVWFFKKVFSSAFPRAFRKPVSFSCPGDSWQERLAWTSSCFRRQHAGRYMRSLSGEFWSGTASWPRELPFVDQTWSRKKEVSVFTYSEVHESAVWQTQRLLTMFSPETEPFSDQRPQIWWLQGHDINQVQCSESQDNTRPGNGDSPESCLTRLIINDQRTINEFTTEMYYNKAYALMHVNIMDNSMITMTKIKATENCF